MALLLLISDTFVIEAAFLIDALALANPCSTLVVAFLCSFHIY